MISDIFEPKPLTNGKLKVPDLAINITEEVNRTDIWKQVNNNLVYNRNHMYVVLIMFTSKTFM